MAAVKLSLFTEDKLSLVSRPLSLLSTMFKLFTNGRPLFQGLSSISSDTIKSLDGPEGVLLSEGEELGEVDGESFIYRLIKVIIDIQGI